MSEGIDQAPRTRRDRLVDIVRPVCERLGIDWFSRPALNGLDRKLERLLPKQGGWFVEAGANDGFHQSNTYHFARFKGWRGVLVEAVPQLAAACRERRPESQVVECALGSQEIAGSTVRLRFAGLMTSVCGTLGSEAMERQRAAQGLAVQGMNTEERFVEAPVRTLTEVLAGTGTPSDFDLLSLDVEGYEVEVLRGLDMKAYRPRAICIEVRRENLNAVNELLGRNYVMIEALCENEQHGDYFWRRRDSTHEQ